MNSLLPARALKEWLLRVFSSQFRGRTPIPDRSPAKGSEFAAELKMLGDGVEPRQALSEAAKQGHSDAQFNLGNLCYSISLRDRATQTSSADRIEAYMWYHLAAAQGHVRAAAACEMLNLQLSDTELQEGNRRANTFQTRHPAPPIAKGMNQHEIPRN